MGTFPLLRSPLPQIPIVRVVPHFLSPQLRPPRAHGARRPAALPQCAMAFASSLAPFFAPSGTFGAHPAKRLRADAPGRFVASSSPPPDVVVTREQGKNARLIVALVSLPMGNSSIVLSCGNQLLEVRRGGRTNGLVLVSLVDDLR